MTALVALFFSPLPACGERSAADGGRVRGAFRVLSLSRGPLTRLAASLLATLSPQAGRGKNTAECVA